MQKSVLKAAISANSGEIGASAAEETKYANLPSEPVLGQITAPEKHYSPCTPIEELANVQRTSTEPINPSTEPFTPSAAQVAEHETPRQHSQPKLTDTPKFAAQALFGTQNDQ